MKAISHKVTLHSKSKEITIVTSVRKDLKVLKAFLIIKLYMMARQHAKFVAKLSQQGVISQGI